MPHSMPDAPEGATTTIADNLREVADWLDAHPDLGVYHAFVRMTSEGREDLERLAAAFGDRATENQPSYTPEVEIRARFGEVSVVGSVPIAKLTGAPPVPEYEPILKR